MVVRRKLLIAVLALTFSLLFIALSCSRKAEETKSAPVKGAACAQESYPMHRGDPSLRGVARGELRADLRLLWKYQTSAPISAPASIWNKEVYVGNENGTLYVLSLETGKLLWSFEGQGEIEGAPLVVDGVVYFGTNDGFFYAVRRGRLVWRFSCDDKIPSGPNWVERKGKRTVLFGSYDNNLYCLDAATGEKIWRYESDNYINGTPAIWRDSCVFGGCDALIHVVDLERGVRKGIFNCEAYIGASVCVAEGKVYVGNFEGFFFCIDLRRLGTEEKSASKKGLVWKIRPTEDPIISSASVAKREVIFGSDDGRIRCVEKGKGTLLWSFLTGGIVRSSPVIAGRTVVASSEDGNLYLLDLETGKMKWKYQIGPPLKASPAVAAGKIVVGVEDGCIYAFGSGAKGTQLKARE